MSPGPASSKAEETFPAGTHTKAHTYACTHTELATRVTETQSTHTNVAPAPSSSSSLTGQDGCLLVRIHIYSHVEGIHSPAAGLRDAVCPVAGPWSPGSPVAGTWTYESQKLQVYSSCCHRLSHTQSWARTFQAPKANSLCTLAPRGTQVLSHPESALETCSSSCSQLISPTHQLICFDLHYCSHTRSQTSTHSSHWHHRHTGPRPHGLSPVAAHRPLCTHWRESPYQEKSWKEI